MAQMSLSTEKKQIHGLGEQTCGCWRGGRANGMDWEFGVNRCKLLHLEWISNEILLYSTGNYMKDDRGSCEKKKYMYVWLGHFAVQ